MARVLVSWLAFAHDFTDPKAGPVTVRPEGPTAEAHRLFWRYDRHVLLSQATEANGDPRLVALQRYLQEHHAHHVVASACAT